MKKMSYFVFLFIFLFSFMSHVYAKEILIVTEDAVRFRSAPTTSDNSNIQEELNTGDELVLLDKEGGAGNGCDEKWYKAQYGSYGGYICSKFVRIETIIEINPEDYEEYSQYLLELGFPEDYVPKLVELHAKHPNWKFAAMTSEIDFSKLVDLEYDGYSKGWSLIEDTGQYFDGYKSFESWSYNYLTDKFHTNFVGGGSVWYAASKKTIAYYLDPRNFLDDKRIFMFEKLSYNANYHTKEGIELMLKGTFMEGKLSDTANNKTYADAFIDAAVAHKLSPYVLVSRVIQEIGAKGSTIVSGTVSGYEGYYNFYNIGAYADNSADTIRNGLAYAKKKGWNTPYKAIIGGASFLGNDYISIGQDTEYLQKWDILSDPKIVNHQYMQNIQAPYYQANKTYNGYYQANLIDSEFTFVIPVYKNMPDKTELPHKGNPNNYLSSLSVNGAYLFKEASNDTEYSLNLDLSTTSVEIAASKVSSKSTITGTGTVAINADEQILPVVVTAENGDIRTYNIKITRSADIAISISEILRLINIKNDGTYISGLELNTDISTIKKNIIDKEPKAEVSAVNKDGEVKTEGIVASGDKIKIKTANEEMELTIVIYGDVSGDGQIDKIDAAAILRHYYNYTSYDGALKMAADVNRDNTIDKVDVAAVLRNLYGYANIQQ